MRYLAARRTHLGMIAAIAATLILLSSPAVATPSFQEVRRSYHKSDAVLLDRHGAPIHELRVDANGRRLDWVALKDVSPSLVRALIRSEDRRFYDHGGVDWIAAGAAAVEGIFGGKRRGASTITMQLSSLLDGRLKPGRSRRTAGQKWDQMHAARDLERTWSKNEILEAYLNLVTFRGELQGIGAASRGLFGKEPQGLVEAEALLLAALVRAPNAPADAAKDRACRLGESLKSSAGCSEITALADGTLRGGYRIHRAAHFAPHVAQALLKGGTTAVRTTLDLETQQFAAAALDHHLRRVHQQNVTDGAVMVVDNATGDVLAYVGNTGEGSSARHIDGVRSRRQAGSTLKPFLYALAFEQRLLTPASLLDDSPLDVPTPLGVYRPENYGGDYQGMVSARTALASSLNVPAVRVIGLTGVEPFVRKMEALGFSRLESEAYYGPSLALGSADVSLFELVNAYRTLANRGVRSNVRVTSRPSDAGRRRVFPEDAAFLVSDILSDRAARGLTFGLENPLSTRYWSAVKTGTSKDMRDNWCIGYSARYTVGVWVGNFSGLPMWNVSGVTGAAPVWIDIMDYLHKEKSWRKPAMPATVAAQSTLFPADAEAVRMEVFSRGTEPSAMVAAHAQAGGTVRIIYPADGTLFAVDPDIPEDNQYIVFESDIQLPGVRWILNGIEVGAEGTQAAWRPRPGRYELALMDASGSLQDRVSFEVRGGE